jgi:GNAT superfamily N-acetyltransferase
MMTLVRDMRNDEADTTAVRELFWEYLQWANGRVQDEFEVSFDIASMLEADMQTLYKFAPPYGRIVLAIHGGSVVGVGCLKRLKPTVGEIKRMFVRPDARGAGVGRALLNALLTHAKAAGYSEVRLDSAAFMKAAHSIYRSAGFHDIDPYPESEIPSSLQSNWVFMAKHLECGAS